MRSKKWTIIMVSALLVVSIVLGLVGVFGVAVGRYDVLSWGESVQLGLDLRGGVYVVYDAQDAGDGNFESQMASTMEVLRRRLDNQGYTEATVNRQGTNRIRVEIPNVDDPKAVLDIIGKPAHLEFREPDGTVIAEGKDIDQCGYEYLQDAGYVVAFKFKSEAATAFSEASSRLVGQKISIYLDDELISAPDVKQAITNGEGYIEGGFTLDGAKELAMLIQSGALPLDLEQTEIRTISATLGEDALTRSIIAGIIGLGLVYLFMLIVYRLPGLVADVALTIYIIIVMYCICLIPGVQLTLPGIAGIILGIGMAVDANVIIFERLKEELRIGKSVRAAVNTAFKKAMVAILDSNITTMIAAVVLIAYGTGSIKGYAYTLAISIVASMITAVLITRMLLQALVVFGVEKPSLFGLAKPKAEKKERNFSVTRYGRWFVLLPVAVILIGVVTGFTGGFNFGIDFAGGTLYTVDLKQNFESDDVVAIVRQTVTDTKMDVRVSVSEETQAVIQIQNKNESGDDYDTQIKQIEADLKVQYPDMEVVSEDRVGATAGSELIRNALTAIGITCVLMLIYISFRFEFLSGVAAVVALIHDMCMMICVVCILNIQVNSSFVAAVLTIMGYSINNTIVVFDRIRDNNRRFGASLTRREIVDKSVRETLTRSINTSLTTLLTILCVYILGVTSIREFSLPIIVGLLFGTYSSVLLSGPFWAWCHGMLDRHKENKRLKASTAPKPSKAKKK